MSAYSPQELWEIVEEWIDVAERELLAARRLCAEEPLTDIAAFHCQQAGEKLLKGYLTWAGRRLERTHDLGVLGAAVAGLYPETRVWTLAMEGWTNWNVVFRYPDGTERPPFPELDDIREAVEIAEAMLGVLRGYRPG